jgi:hypothetical protein
MNRCKTFVEGQVIFVCSASNTTWNPGIYVCPVTRTNGQIWHRVRMPTQRVRNVPNGRIPGAQP